MRPEETPAPTPFSSGGSQPPIPLVGRKSELDWLRSYIQEAHAGKPHLLLITGEAGCGKTRLGQELDALARSAGFWVCHGRAHQDLPHPYLPFLEILRDQLSDAPEAVARLLGADAQRLAAISHGEGLLEPTSHEPTLDPLHNRAGLFVSVSDATLAIARIRPTLLLLDDLQWADGTTLDQLLQLTFAISDAAPGEPLPLLLVALERPAEPGGRFARSLERLRREPICEELELGGLDEEELTELIVRLGVERPARQLVNELGRVTDGNPLFVKEMVRQLQRDNAMRETGGYLALTRSLEDLSLPRDLLSAVAARAQGVGERCRELLTLAAFLGGRFSVADLGATSGFAEEELLDLLEEAERQLLLRSHAEHCEFAHPLIREVLYSAPSAPRRARIHRSIAADLERHHGTRATRHSLEIGHHLVQAGTAADPARLLRFARIAGDEAFSRFAWGAAARFYEAAASAAARVESASQTAAELHFRAGVGHYRNMDAGPCAESFDKALAGYRLQGDDRGIARTLVERTRAQVTMGVRFGEPVDLERFQEALDSLPDDETELRGWVLVMLAEAHITAMQAEKAEAAACQSLVFAQRAESDTLCAHAQSSCAMALVQQLRLREALEREEASLAAARRSGDPWVEGWPLQRMPLLLTWLGAVKEAERIAVQACELSHRTQDWAEYSLALGSRVLVAVIEGDFEEAERLAEATMQMAHRSHYPWGAIHALAGQTAVRALRGDFASAEHAIGKLAEPGEVFEDAGPAISFVARIFHELLQILSGSFSGDPGSLSIRLLLESPQPRPDPQTLTAFCAGVEAAARLGDATLAARCAERLVAAAEGGALFSTGWPFLIPRMQGMAASMNGRFEAADAHFATALRVASENDAQPELAWTRLELARMLARRCGEGDRDHAVELLRGATPIFSVLGMAPHLEQAAELASQLDIPALEIQPSRAEETSATAPLARQSSGPEAKDLALMVTDLEGFTPLVERLGDERAQEVLRTHNLILRACLQAYRGREIQHTGDGFIAAFPSTKSALLCAAAMQRDLARHNAREEETRIKVRIGLHAGKARAVEDRLFGAALNAAVRICSLAQPTRILASEAVRDSAAGTGFEFQDRGRAALKGFAEPFQLFEVDWNDHQEERR